MKIYTTLLATLLLFCFACQSGQDNGDATLTALEKEVEANPNSENSKQLIDQYLAEVSNNPEDVETNASYLYRAASLYYRQNRFSNAADLLKRAIKDYGTATSIPNTMMLLSTIFQENLKNTDIAQAIYNHVKDRYPDTEQGKEAASKIRADGRSMEAAIEDIGGRMYNDSTFRIDNRLAVDFVNTCEMYALLRPSDTKSPDYLFKAGETARTVRNFTKALELYDWVYTRYPDFEKSAQALFLKGFTLDNDLGKHQEAKAIYETFLAKYPNDDFADDTQFLLSNIGKSDDEIIQNFEKK
ncbi:MAG: tetratricopeptide repeat protein [Bacteroidota bacterium]